MKTNMGSIDRIARIIAAIIIAVLYFTGQITGIAAVILLILATIFIVTGFISFCPLYSLFGIQTKPKKKA
ncbi:MAG: DUF2892 domain-containing protein [Bacteroidia bacterium]|jgi:Na+(H+)/acetate symporter ActP|nr:DUF2892 domain-containing protein [Bacteroidia bacterium]